MKPVIKMRLNAKGDPRYTVYLPIWSDGKRKDKTVGTFGDRSEAERHGWREAEKYIDDPQERAAVHATVVLRDWVPRWLLSLGDQNKRGTVDTYRWRMEKWVLPELGSKRLSDITAPVIYRWLDEMSHLSLRSKKSALVALSRCLSRAVDRGMLTKNPCDDVRLTQSKARRKSQKRKVRVWSIEDTLKLLATDSPLAVLGIYGGLRRGEMLGASWGDIDWVAGTIHVHRNVVSTNYRTLDDEDPKSGEDRTVNLAPAAVAALKRIKESSTGDRILAYSPAHATRLFAALCKKVGVPALGLHSTRHTCASILLSQRESIVDVADHLGHSDPRTTLEFYAHLMVHNASRCADALESALGTVDNRG